MPLRRPGPAGSPPAPERARPRDGEHLAAALAHPDPMVRRWSARDLADWPGHSAALVARLAHEPEASVREVIFTTLTALGDPVAVAGMAACLRSEEAGLRREAIEALQLLPSAVAPIMSSLLHDADPDVRIFAVNVLESLRHPDVEAWLLEVIEHDPHLNVCATAVDLLGEVGSAAARAPLTRLRARFADQPYIAFATDLALSRIQEG